MTTTECAIRTTTWDSHQTDLAGLVEGARSGCPTSWREIVDRYDNGLQQAARAHRLDPATAADVVQQTWLAAVTHIEALRDAEALGGWLHAILRRTCLRVINLRRTEAPSADDGNSTESPRNGWSAMMHTETRSPEEEVLRGEQRMLVRTARHRLSHRDQDLLVLLMEEPRRPYAEISRRLGMPVGSIGPTRNRCLDKLRRELATLGVRGG